jgi:predicted PurR-regulated permease PerM
MSAQIASQGTQDVNNYVDLIQQNISSQQNYLNQINSKNSNIYQKQQIQINQLKEIEDKEKLLLTRSRMLQIAQDRNSYKKKIIYTLLSVIFAIFILILVVYVLFTRKLSMSK